MTSLAERLRRLPRMVLAAVVVLGALPVLGFVAAVAVAPGSSVDLPEAQVVSAELHVPNSLGVESDGLTKVTMEVIQRGDTLGAMLGRLAINDPEAFSFIKADATARRALQLRPGRTLQAHVDEDGELQKLIYPYSAESAIEIERTEDGFAAKERRLAVPSHIVLRSGVVRSSLFAATDAAGVPDAVAAKFARIFSANVDFHTDLRSGDRFSIAYEEGSAAAGQNATGRVVAAEFINRGTRYAAVLFVDEDGGETYYSPDGNNLEKGFLRSPLEFSRVSSGFGGRIHPIFRHWRAHRGVDFAAPRGTPVWATSDATVEFVGRQNGYGNAIVLKHRGEYTTLYGHLDRIAAGVGKGVKVKQGQVIGYVGATGWATGPHLHYEFRIAGEHYDPLKVALPPGAPVPAALKPRFMQAAGSAETRLALAQTTIPARFE